MPFVLSIDGNIGSGKSTFIQKLKEYYQNNNNIGSDCNRPVIFVPEPVSVWESIKNEDNSSMLELFYENTKKYAFSFQILCFISRINALQTAIKNAPKNAVIIIERSVYTDKCVFAKMLNDSNDLESVEYVIYKQLFDLFTKNNNCCNLYAIVYINTSPTICKERIKIRNRSGEENISMEYLQNCDNCYAEMLGNFRQSKITILNGNQNIHESEDMFQNWLSQINNIIMEKNN